MRGITSVLAIVFGLSVAGGVANAEPWDPKGWVKLGEREVNCKYDHDKITVGRYEGTFTKLTLYVEKSEIELLDFEITFGNGERFHPEVKHFFREGTRTRVIDLPGDKRIIRDINLRYKNLPGGGRARVEVWGWKAGEAHGGGGGGWDSHGWQMLGERTVAHRVDHDTIEVGAYKGRFAKLTMYVLDNELELFDMDIKFGNGEHFHPEAKFFFKEGSRTRIIDLPGDERVIKRIDLRYKSIPGEGKAKVQVWAK